MAAHRYWRLLVTDNNGTGGNGLEIAELEMHTAAGGADVCSGGTAAVSSIWSGSAANVFDNSNATVWQGVAHPPSTDWVRYDFGAGVTKDIVEIAVTAGGGGAALQVKAGQIQFSDDNSSWTTLWSFAAQTGWTAGETRTFTYVPPISDGVSVAKALGYAITGPALDAVSVTKIAPYAITGPAPAAVSVAKITAYVVADSFLEVSKAVGYAVLGGDTRHLEASKAIGYAVLGGDTRHVEVSKAVGYVVLLAVSGTAQPVVFVTI